MAEKPVATETMTAEEALAQQILAGTAPEGLQKQIEEQLKECRFCGEIVGTADVCPHCDMPQHPDAAPPPVSTDDLSSGQEV